MTRVSSGEGLPDMVPVQTSIMHVAGGDPDVGRCGALGTELSISVNSVWPFSKMPMICSSVKRFGLMPAFFWGLIETNHNYTMVQF